MRLHSIQYLRAVAALGVVHFHAVSQVPDYFDLLVETGQGGVDLFFVISGLVMVLAGRPEDSPGRFALRRIVRIVPLYWFFTLSLVLVTVVAPSALRNVSLDPAALLLSLSFVPYLQAGAPLPSGPQDIAPLLVPGWTLNYEMYFYALLAIATLAAPRRRTLVATLSLLAILLLCSASGSTAAAALFYGDPIVLEFVFGMMAGHTWRAGWRLGRGSAWLACAIGAIALLVEPDVPRVLGAGLPATLLVFGVMCLEPGRFRIGSLLGEASYAIYLSHLFALGAVRTVLPPLLGDGPGAAVAFVILAMTGSVAAGVVAHVAIERPLLRLGTRGLLRMRTSAHAR